MFKVTWPFKNDNAVTTNTVIKHYSVSGTVLEILMRFRIPFRDLRYKWSYCHFSDVAIGIQ